MNSPLKVYILNYIQTLIMGEVSYVGTRDN